MITRTSGHTLFPLEQWEDKIQGALHESYVQIGATPSLQQKISLFCTPKPHTVGSFETTHRRFLLKTHALLSIHPSVHVSDPWINTSAGGTATWPHGPHSCALCHDMSWPHAALTDAHGPHAGRVASVLVVTGFVNESPLLPPLLQQPPAFPLVSTKYTLQWASRAKYAATRRANGL
ncbi:hypothetical protein Vafri_11353 [Volvox africanus]|nr:hypothetical protein Vafri_11353 [Volvox africanus]